MQVKSRAARGLGVLILVGALQGLPALAVDNPDGPDPVAAFGGRAKVMEQKIYDPANTDQQTLAAFAQYEQFLEKELNQAYSSLIKHLPDTRKQDLIRAQKSWLVFRDGELHFIANNWTPQDFGSSSTLSKAAYRCALTRSRVDNLLNYLRSYASAN